MLSPFDFDPPLLAVFTHQLPDYRWFFFLVTQLGSPLTLSALAALGFFLGKNRMKLFSAILIIGLLFSIVIVDDVKEIAQRPRPSGANLADFLVGKSYSFPSGHAFSIFLAVSILGAYFGWKYYLAGYVAALAVSLSRLYIGVHYPSDIAAGALLGLLMGELLVYAAYRLSLCNNYGLLSLVRRPKETVVLPPIKGPDMVLTLSVFLTLIASIALYFLDFAPLAIFVLTMDFLFIVFYLIWRRIEYDRILFMAFTTMAISLIASIAMLFLGAYMLSLVIVLVAYGSTLAMAWKGQKSGV